MRFRSLLLCVAVLTSGIVPASATMRIAEDRGGQIGHYLQVFAMLRSSGEQVMIDGNCLSACTLVLGLVPRERICATPRARFGFHAAWMPDAEGRPVTSAMGTQALWNIYPSHVRRWINKHGGLSRKMIFLQGHELGGIVASCEQPARRVQARSERRLTTGSVRYERAAAASDRR
ncbi:MAG: hypothetical protein ABI830_15405 [Pseudolabrys sp.]